MTNVSIGNIENQKEILSKLDGLIFDSQGNALDLEDLKKLLEGIKSNQGGQATYARQTTGLNNDQEILDKLSDGVIAKAVKSVQRGSFNTSLTSETHTVSISRVNTSKSFILINTYSETASSQQTYIKSFTSTGITFHFGRYSYARTVDWQLVEFY